MPLLLASDVFLTDGNRVSAATVASTAIAAAQWAVTQVTFLDGLSVLQRKRKGATRLVSNCVFMIIFLCFCLTLLNLFHFQTAQNGSGGGQSIDTAVYQQGAAVTYSQEGNEYSGLDGTTFKAQADVRVAALPSAGAGLIGAYTGGAAPGWYHIC